MEAPRNRPGGLHALPPHARYEIERAQAGNPLFCPVARAWHSPKGGLPTLYEDAAQLLKLLVASGLESVPDYHGAIISAANVLFVSAENEASGSDCAEYLLYCLQGLPKAGAHKKESRFRAIIGTFYANLRITQSLARA